MLIVSETRFRAHAEVVYVQLTEKNAAIHVTVLPCPYILPALNTQSVVNYM